MRCLRLSPKSWEEPLATNDGAIAAELAKHANVTVHALGAA